MLPNDGDPGSLLATLNEVTQGALLHAIEVKFTCIGAGPELDYTDASAFFSGFQSAIDAVLKRTRMSRATTPFLPDRVTANGQRTCTAAGNMA